MSAITVSDLNRMILLLEDVEITYEELETLEWLAECDRRRVDDIVSLMIKLKSLDRQ